MLRQLFALANDQAYAGHRDGARQYLDLSGLHGYRWP
jgi:hypothetical protein